MTFTSETAKIYGFKKGHKVNLGRNLTEEIRNKISTTKKKRMNNFQKGFIVGILEGEGCISIVRKKHPTMSCGYQLTPVVSIVNTNLELLTYIQSIIGGKIYSKSTKNPRHKPVHHLLFNRRDLIKDLLFELLPYFIGFLLLLAGAVVIGRILF